MGYNPWGHKSVGHDLASERVHTDTHTHTDTHRHRDTDTHTETHGHTHTQTHRHRHTHIHTHRHSHTQTYTYTHTDTHILAFLPGPRLGLESASACRVLPVHRVGSSLTHSRSGSSAWGCSLLSWDWGCGPAPEHAQPGLRSSPWPRDIRAAAAAAGGREARSSWPHSWALMGDMDTAHRWAGRASAG